MKRFLFTLLIIIVCILMTNPNLSAQGISRSTGIGVRLSFWNITGQPTQIDVRGDRGQVKVDVSGAGGGMYFFSRAYQEWFFELSLSAIGSVETDQNISDTYVNVETIVPFLLGLRYYVLSTRLSGAIHPYLNLGGGPYWATSVQSNNTLIGNQETVVSDLEYGGYLGGGINFVMASFFALNFDLKYHFIEFQPDKDYSGLELGMGFCLMWGRKREAIRILGTELVVSDIYPAHYQFYSIYPLAFVTVQNLLGQAIDVNVRSTIKGYSERAKDSGFIRIKRGETRRIPVTVFFGKRFQEVAHRRTAILDLMVEARASTVYKQDISAQLTIHSRNAWDGDMRKLGFFVTPEDEEILHMSRQLASEIPPEQRASAKNLNIARYIFNQFTDLEISYLADPNIPFYQDDRVQYAAETLDIGSGDCDDLVILYASFLESLGINTAFVEVRDSEKDLAHLYLLFDSGLPVSQAHLVSSNDKRYLIRENASGQKIIWIPVETTLVDQGFEEAWKTGALAYYQEGILRNGIAEGWVTIID